MYRLIMSWLIMPANRFSDGLVEFERVLRLEALALAFLAGLLLWTGLRRRWPSVAATLSLTVAAALALVGPAIVLEPEWLAVVVTVAGVGVALMLPSRPPWGLLSAILGGLLFAVAAAIKVVSLPIAMIGLVALLLVDRRRCAIALVGAIIGGLAWIISVALMAPWEFQWMIDTAAMVPDRGDPDVHVEATVFLGNVAVIWPTAALLPAALVGLARNHLVAGVLGVLLAWLPVTLQNQYFLYHASAVPVIGAVLLYGALRRAGPLFAPAIVALSGWTYYVLTNSVDWRLTYQRELFTVVAVAAGSMVMLSIGWHVWRFFRSRSGGPRPITTLLATLVLVTAWLPASAPTAAESVTLSTRNNTPVTNRTATQGQLNLGRGDAPADRTGHAGDLPDLRHHQLSARQPLHLRVPDERVPATQPHRPPPGGHAHLAGQPPLPDRQAGRAADLGPPVVPAPAAAPGGQGGLHRGVRLQAGVHHRPDPGVHPPVLTRVWDKCP